jgi:hypothetical protein
MAAYEHFLSSWREKYPKAAECLQTDREELFTFFDFPASHWVHIRTTNPIESTYATVRLRTKKTKGCGSRAATLTMVFKLALEAQKTWRRLMGHEQIPLVMAERSSSTANLRQRPEGEKCKAFSSNRMVTELLHGERRKIELRGGATTNDLGRGGSWTPL